MWSYNHTYPNELYHYGVLGMKWGVRRYQNKDGSLTSVGKKRYNPISSHIQKERELKEKITVIKNKQGKNINESDKRRLSYREQPYYRRLGSAVASAAVQTVISDAITGRITKYGAMSKKDIAKKVAGLLGVSVANTVIRDRLAESTIKGYTKSGRRKKKSGLITKEDAIETAISTASRVAPGLLLILNYKMMSIGYKNRKNREQFESWAGNILSEKVDNIVWQSDDLKMAIIDNRNR